MQSSGEIRAARMRNCALRIHNILVMPGLKPGIHADLRQDDLAKRMDFRVEPGNDGNAV